MQRKWKDLGPPVPPEGQSEAEAPPLENVWGVWSGSTTAKCFFFGGGGGCTGSSLL